MRFELSGGTRDGTRQRTGNGDATRRDGLTRRTVLRTTTTGLVGGIAIGGGLAGAATAASKKRVSFEEASPGSPAPADPWYVLRDGTGAGHTGSEISTSNWSKGSQSLRLNGNGDPDDPVAVAVMADLSNVASIVFDPYLERTNASRGGMYLGLSAGSAGPADDRVLGQLGDLAEGRYLNAVVDVSDITGVHELYFQVSGTNEGFFDNLRFADAGDDLLPIDDVLQSSGGGGDDDQVDVQSIDPYYYPLVCQYVQIDTVTGRNGDVTRDQVFCYEDGQQRAIDDFHYLGGADDAPIDVTFVFDDTGSMRDEIDAMQANVREFANDIEARGFDARYGLVSFKDSEEVDQPLTGDLDRFEAAVDDLVADAGGDEPEDDFDALEAALNLNYRRDAEEVIIDITDRYAHYDGDGTGFTDWTLDEMADRLLREGVTYVAVCPPESDPDGGGPRSSKQVLADRVGGRWIDITSEEDFGVILDELVDDLTTGRYLICWETPLDCFDEVRTVRCVVDDPEQGEIESQGQYIPPDHCGEGGDDVVIQSIDPSDYPLICEYVRVDTPAGREGRIGRDDVVCYEEGVQRDLDDFRYLGGDDDYPIDIAFVFDDTGSMREEIDAMQASVTDLANDIERRGFDARYGLVSFKDAVDLDQTLTADVDRFEAAVGDLVADGGGDEPEDDFDAIETALELDYRPGAERVIVDITDKYAHYDGDGDGVTDWTLDEMADRLLREGVTYVAVCPPESAPDGGSDRSSKQVLADEVGGRWIDITSEEDFGVILEELVDDLTTGRYLICWETPLVCDPGDRQFRTVGCFVQDPGQGELQTYGQYYPPEDCGDDADTRVYFDPDYARAGPGSDVGLDLVVENVDGGVGAYDLDVSLTDGDVASIVDATGVQTTVREFDVSRGGSRARIASFGNDTVDSGSVTILRLALEVEGGGTTTVQVRGDVGDEAGDEYVTSFGTATVEAIPDGGGVDVDDDGNPSNDLDGDGLHEDVDGDGDQDIFDVQAMFDDYTGDGDVRGQAQFDFDGDGDVDIFDVQAFFEDTVGG